MPRKTARNLLLNGFMACGMSWGENASLPRVSRLQQGNYGDCEPVGEGVSELRLFFGSGYRVYFGEQENHIIILLCGGGKATQAKDIEQAKTFWKDYLSHE